MMSEVRTEVVASGVVVDEAGGESGGLARMVMLGLNQIEVGPVEMRGVEEDPELVGLAESIRRDGLVNPLTVSVRDGAYVLVAGHRRYSACVLARVSPVPCMVRVEGAGRMNAIAFAENFHRKDLNPIQQAAAIAGVIGEGCLSVEEVCRVFRRSEEWVHDQVGMLGWPEDVRGAVERRELSVAAAAPLARISDGDYRGFLVRCAVDGGATARTTAGWLQGWVSQRPAGEVVQTAVSGPGSSSVGRIPETVCMGCRTAFRPDAMVPVLVCPSCITRMRDHGVGP